MWASVRFENRSEGAPALVFAVHCAVSDSQPVYVFLYNIRRTSIDISHMSLSARKRLGAEGTLTLLAVPGDASVTLSLFAAIDMGIMQDIIREAYARRNIAEGEQVELVDVLRAFEFVLRSHGRVPDQDSVHYHLLIKLSKLSIPDWRDKLAWYKQVSWPSFLKE